MREPYTLLDELREDWRELLGLILFHAFIVGALIIAARHSIHGC